MNTTTTRLLERLLPRHVVMMAVAAALIAFLPSLADGFVFDDGPLIERNPFAHELAYAGRCFTTDLWDTPERPDAEASTRFYRPAVCVSYILNWKIGGGAPWTFHLVNVALHALACALAARLALRWTRSVPGAALAALTFAIHPSRTENVIWVSGRTDVLMAAFLFGAHEVSVSAARRPGAFGKWLLAAALFGAAILSKEFAVCWPLLLTVEAFLRGGGTAGRSGHGGDDSTEDTRAVGRRLARAAVLSLVVVVAYLVIRSSTLPIRPKEVDSMALPLGLHLGYVALSLGYYTERTFFPWPQTFHFRPLAIVGGEPVLFMPSVALGVVAAALFVFWLFRAWKKDRGLFAVLAASMVVVLPILNVSYTGFPGTTADRFLYLPLFLLAVAAGRHGGPSLERWGRRPLSAIVTTATCLVACAICWVRSLDYLSNETVWRHELEVNPDNPQALAGLGQMLSSAGDLDEASLLLRRALSPAALRYRLLANPSRYYLGLVEIQGPRLADGNVSALEALLGELASLEGLPPPAGRPSPGKRAGDLSLDRPTWDEHFPIHLANASQHIAAAGVLVASRLGHDHGTDDLLHAFLARVGDGRTLDAGGHYNLALALARASDYGGAERELARAVATDDGVVVRSARAELEDSITRVGKLRADAARLPEAEGRVLRAAAFTELGAYVRAARQLRAAHTARPDDKATAGAYLDALVRARLDADADALVVQMADPQAARARVEEVRGHLSERTTHALAPSRGEKWWGSPPDDG